ncbi:MAG: non-ribosomal peptide synthetase, partial [Acidobacteriota bacterium]
ERGIGPETLVGICLDRSARLVTTFLAVFKAGAGYVYLDPKYPAERLQQMIEDTRPPVLITQASLDAMLGEALASDRDAAATPRWTLDRDADLAVADTTRPPRRVDGDNLALVVYTSGSTGRPKGSGVTYRNVARTVLELEERYFDLREDDVFMQGATPSFDVAIWEIWAPLTHGAALVGAERDELLNLATLDAKLRREGVTVADFMTALLHQIAEERPSMFADLRAITFGGERCDPRWVRVVRASTDARLVHCYGPTECTTTATAFDVDEVAEGAASVPIGPPTTNTEILVLDRHGKPCPVGVPGELCLGGSGLVRGYLLRSRSTAEKFVPHPTGDGHDGPGARIYRTGDLVRLLPSGALDFLGRIDRQVKIRGFRIEPGEVEATLAAHPAVGRAVVVVREAENDRHLIAYATPEEGGERPSVETLLQHLRDDLPAFMQPAAVMVLDALPFTAHGKVDQRALPAPELRRAEARREAETALERFLGDLWASVLKLDAVPALDDDFFDLGGHSLLAAKVFSRLNEAVVVEVPLRLLFDHPHLGSFAKALEDHLGGSDAGRQALELIELMDSMSDDDADTLMGSDD